MPIHKIPEPTGTDKALKLLPLLAILFSLGSSFFGYYVTTELGKVRAEAKVMIDSKEREYLLDKKDIDNQFKELQQAVKRLDRIELDIKTAKDDFESFKNYLNQNQASAPTADKK